MLCVKARILDQKVHLEIFIHEVFLFFNLGRGQGGRGRGGGGEGEGEGGGGGEGVEESDMPSVPKEYYASFQRIIQFLSII